jgi:type II secretory ATPase GspE/PulE/Tfp pilus assembly ATPase PilB-like protein
MVVGPAGSGKTTTAYAALREMTSNAERALNVMSAEDPVEAEISGVSQTATNETSGLDLGTTLKSLLRHDPDVIFVGEIRDPVTAAQAMQAALTGRLVLSTFHASGGVEAVQRLLDMDVPEYVLRSGLKGILTQRLVRRCCECRELDQSSCKKCGGSGYYGRVLLAEWTAVSRDFVAACRAGEMTSRRRRQWHEDGGGQSLAHLAQQAVAERITTLAEIAAAGIVEYNPDS